MDLFKLGSTVFKPLDLLEGWDSLIWTERYRDAGDFELTSYNVDEIVSLLPTGDPDVKPSMVCIRDSREAMIVESHEIKVDDDGRRYVVTKGRTFESFLEQRVHALLSNTPVKMTRGYSDPGAIAVIVWNALCNDSLNDVVLGSSTHEPTDKIPNVRVADSCDVTLSNKPWWIESDYVYPKVLDFLQRNNLGIRNVRGITAGPKDLITVGDGNGGTTLGQITRTTTSDIDDLIVDIYNGHVRTKDQTILTPVIFTEAQGHVVNSRYFISNTQLKNVGYITSASLHGFVYWDTTDGSVGDSNTWVGLKKRVLHFDAGSKWGSTTPTPFTTLYDNTVAAMTQKAEVKTKRHRKTNWYDGQITDNSPYKYNTHYFLGDKVSFIGDYEISKNVQVTEYTRIHDAQGERAFPTLTFDGT